MLRRLITVVLLVVPVLAACDLGPKDGDEAYVEGWCRATNQFSDALVTAADVQGIAVVIEAYGNALDDLQPEEDVAAFHEAFLAYIDGVAANPAGLSEGDPPEPPSDVRLRLEAVASGMDARQEIDLFGR